MFQLAMLLSYKQRKNREKGRKKREIKCVLASAVWCDCGVSPCSVLLLWGGLHWLPCLRIQCWGSDSVLPRAPRLGGLPSFSHGYHPCVR